MEIHLNMLRSLFPVLLLCAVSSSEDAIYFPSVPDSVMFNTVDAMHSSEVADAFSSMLSYTLVKPCDWQSLGPVNPLKRPEAICVLNLIGVAPDLEFNMDGPKFTLENLHDIDDQSTLLFLRTNERHRQQSPVLLKIDAGEELYGPKSEQRVLLKSIPADSEGRLEKAKEDSELGRTIQEGTFNISNPPDVLFLVELETVKLLLNAITENKALLNNGVPDIYWVQLRGLHGIIKEYGIESNEAKEAVRLLQQIITEVITTMNTVYANRAVVSVIQESTLPYSLSRKTRDILQSTTTAPETNGTIDALHPGNLAYFFDNDFNVAFALTGFTSVVLILAVLGVSVAMWFMDPGRDSIIYRMTSQRKKD